MEYEELLEQFNFAHATLNKTQELKGEVHELKSKQNQFLNEIEISKYRLVREIEDQLREKCEIKIMENAYLNSGKWQDVMEIQILRLNIRDMKI